MAITELQQLVNYTDITPTIGKWQGVSRFGTDWTVYKGDASAVLRTLESEIFDCAVTSPPYFWLRDYGHDDQIGLEESVDEYVTSVCNVFDEVRRTLKQNALLFLNLGDTYYSGKGESQGIDPKSKSRRFGLRAVDRSGGLGIGLRPKSLIGIPWRVAVEMTSRGWILRSSIIWHRKSILRESAKDRPGRSYEFVFMFAKDKRYFFNRQALHEHHIDEDVWSITARPKHAKGIGTAPYPDELVRRCLAIGCPEAGSVLDPFGGSGTTLRVSAKTGRSATGIDVNPEFCEFMVAHLSKAKG